MTNDHDADSAATVLRNAVIRVETLRSERVDHGLDRAELKTVSDAYRSVETVLDRWEERATDWDDFEGYVKFRNDLAGTLESIPDDVPEREAFLNADDHVKTGSVSKSLSSEDFEAAREALTPVKRYADLQSNLESAQENHREAIRQARKRRSALRERISALERLLELGEADLDAPTDRLEEPIDDYNERIVEAFESFKRETAAETFLEFIDRAAHIPLVDFESPPTELIEYVCRDDAGEYSVDELLEYAEYSGSKLSHYVENAELLKRRVATNRTYLERLSADPFRIGWPPETSELLQFRIEELVGLVSRFGDESAIVKLREILAVTRTDEYERIRSAARAESALTDDERRRLEDGAVESELRDLRETLEILESCLDENSDLD